jgi:UDP-N-acetyl-2-amino-2-deoxyglucuronate dehydrogenase
MEDRQQRFALIGAAGYIAPRHMKAIRETGNVLTAVLDKFDGLGIIDSYFPEADIFLEPERFDRHLDKLRRKEGMKIDYVSICSPNYLHDSHIRLALRNDADAICEKPLVLNPWNVDALCEMEKETGRRINNILQLRHHETIIRLKEKVDANPDKVYDIDLSYITSRGKWYHWSWKGDQAKSGGVTTNIGIHFFDMLIWIFGLPRSSRVHWHDASTASGFLELGRARVRWFLSIDQNMLPAAARARNMRTYRSILVDDEEIEFSEGFTDLHTVSYREILAGQGFGLDAARPSIDLAYSIRTSKTETPTGDYHPFLQSLLG